MLDQNDERRFIFFCVVWRLVKVGNKVVVLLQAFEDFHVQCALDFLIQSLISSSVFP